MDTGQTPDTTAPEEKRGRSGLIWWMLLILPVVYVLSIGPAYGYLQGRRSSITYERVASFYMPLRRIANEHKTVRDVVNAYINWWQARIGKKRELP